MKRVDSLIGIIAGLLMTANVSGQGGIMPFLYLEDKQGETTEIQFTDGTMTIMENQILIGTPAKQYEFDYDAVERFYFKDYQSAALSNLAVSAGVLSPVFSSNVLNYTVNVPNNTSSVTITATANDEKATVTGDGIKTLAAGENTFTITVTAEDGVTTLKYKITINIAGTTTDITTDDSDFEVKIYPNPTDGIVTVHIPDGLNEFKLISIYTVAGQQIEDKTVTDEYTYFGLKDEPEGVYLVKIFKKSGQTIIKTLVKQ